MGQPKVTPWTTSADYFSPTSKRLETRWRSTCALTKVVEKWNTSSSELQGLALDNARGFLFVACGDHVVSVDIGHGGKTTDSMTTGPGLDNIDYSAERKVLYAAASEAATLTIADVDDHGKFHLKATVPTVRGTRGVIAAKGETAYLIDPAEGRILKLTHK